MQSSNLSCFNVVGGKWQEANGIVETSLFPTSLRIVTLNVLFSHWRGKEYHHAWVMPSERYDCIFSRLSEMNADVVSFNECTVAFCEQLARHAVAEEFFLGGLDCLGDGGNVLLVRKTLSAKFFCVHLPRVPRAAVACRVGESTIVCSAHLSALNKNHQRRAEQLRVLTETLEGHQHEAMVICGDLNFHSEEENKNVSDGWTDTKYEVEIVVVLCCFCSRLLFRASRGTRLEILCTPCCGRLDSRTAR
jgi:hypothetical protein